MLAFPCNQFLYQEPGTDEEILEFVDKNFGAKEKFHFFKKGDVNGKHAREVFSFLKQKLPNPDGTKDLRWNFTKFLVDHEGNPYKRFGGYGSQEPYKYMKDSIEELLRRKENST